MIGTVSYCILSLLCSLYTRSMVCSVIVTQKPCQWGKPNTSHTHTMCCQGNKEVLVTVLNFIIQLWLIIQFGLCYSLTLMNVSLPLRHKVTVSFHLIASLLFVRSKLQCQLNCEVQSCFIWVERKFTAVMVLVTLWSIFFKTQFSNSSQANRAWTMILVLRCHWLLIDVLRQRITAGVSRVHRCLVTGVKLVAVSWLVEMGSDIHIFC